MEHYDFSFGFGDLGGVVGVLREAGVIDLGEGKMLASGLVILAGVGLGFGAERGAEVFFGAGLAKQKAPSLLEGTSAFQVDTWV